MGGTGVWALAVCCDARLGRTDVDAIYLLLAGRLRGTASMSLFHTCAGYMGFQSAVIRVVYLHMYLCDGASTVRLCLVQSTWRWKCSIMALSTFRQTAGRPRMRRPWLKPPTSVLYFSHCKDTRGHTLALSRGERKDLAMTFGWDAVRESTMGGCRMARRMLVF